MGDHLVEAREDAVDCVSSLQIALQQAGGSCLSVHQMRSMTLLQFISTVASQNGIRFVYSCPASIQIAKPST